jgi:ATP-dependent RNA helicase DDX55/SPB4
MQWDTYSYADEAQEAKRIKSSSAQVQRSSDFKSTDKRDHMPWSKQLAKKDAKEKRHAKKVKKRQWLASTQPEEKHAGPKRMRADSEEKIIDPGEGEDDWASLAEEERLAKKLKKGKISQAEFDATTFTDL